MPAMEFLLGIAVGYVVVSVCESFFHRTIQHAAATLRTAYGRFGRPGRALLRAWYAHHVVHHHLTFRSSHVTQFSRHDEQPRLDSFLISRGKQHVIAKEYGSRIGPRLNDYLLYVTPTLPIFTAVCWAGGTVFTCGALIPFSIWPMLAQFVHPYIHMEYLQISAKAPFIIKAFSRTPYFRYLAIHHWLHHRYENCNYNLLLGGDVILGAHRSPTAADLAEMRAIGMWTPQHCLQSPSTKQGSGHCQSKLA